MSDPAAEQPARPSLDAAWRWTFATLRAQAATFASLAAVVMVLQFMQQVAVGPSQTVTLACLQIDTSAQREACASTMTDALPLIGLGVLFLLLSVVSMVGIQRAALHSTRGVVPAFSDLLTTRNLGTYALFVLAFGVLLVVGLALCLLPGVLVAFYLQLSPYYIIDRGMGVRAAMAASRRSISANPSAAVMMLLVNTAAFVLGGALFGIMTLVTLPIATVFTAHLYRQFNHEPVA